MSTSVPRRDELDSNDVTGKRSSTPEGFLALLRLHEKNLYKAAWALCDRADSIEHLVERTVLSLWYERSRSSLDQPFRRCLAGKLIDAARITRVSLSASFDADTAEAREARELSSELSARVHHAMQTLTWDCREIFVLRDLMGFTAVECAEVLRITHVQAKQLLSDARLGMAKKLSTPVSSAAIGGGL